MYMQQNCWWQHSAYCCKGWHYEAEENEDGAKRSLSQEIPKTPKGEDTESDRPEKRRKKRTVAEETDFQIALARLKLDTEEPDMAMLENAYRQRMIDVKENVPETELLDKCNELTWAFRLVLPYVQTEAV